MWVVRNPFESLDQWGLECISNNFKKNHGFGENSFKILKMTENQVALKWIKI